MRVGIDTLFLDGTQRSSLANFVIALVESLVKNHPDNQYVLFASATTARFFDQLPGGIVELVECPVSNEHRLARIMYQQIRLPVLIRETKIDVMCCLADVMPILVDVPTVLKITSLHHFTAPKSLGVPRSLYRRVMIGASARRASIVVANSVPTLEDIKQYLRVPLDRIRLVYEAVDECFAPCPDAAKVREYLRGNFGISRDYLLFVSALYRYKNLDAVIMALARLSAMGEWDGDLVVAGPDPHNDRPRSERRAEELGVASRVKFLGAVPNPKLRELYCGATVFVYPSSSETYGKPIVEAMRCGTPIVAADRGSIPDIAAGAALLVDPGDNDALVRAVRRLFHDDALRTRLRQAGFQRGRDFSWQKVAEGFAQTFEEAVI